MNIIDIAIAKQLAGGGGSGTDSYNDLSNLPKINDVTLSGNKSSSALGLQSEITSDSKLASDLVDDTNQDNKFVTSTEKNTWNGKQNAIDSDHKLSSDLVDDANKTNKFVTSTEKNTWNAKQNAIDSDHKLSSSLVSFTTAEAAALASGIDSTKVAQISTNQTNILLVKDATEELVDESAKNVLNHNGTSFVSNGVRITYNSDKTITFVRETASNNDTFAQIRYDSNLVFIDDYCDGNHVLSGCPAGGSSSTYLISVKNDAQTYTADNDHGNGILLPSRGSASGIYIQMVYRSTYSDPITFKPMICTKAKWDISHEYEPYVLPNYDLTKLEAEDRAVLAEVVDDGAKNEFIFGEFSNGSGANVSIDNNAVTVSGEQAWAKGYRAFRVTKNTTYVLSFRVTNVTTVANPHYRVSLGNDPSSGAIYYGIIACDTTGHYYMIFTSPTNTDIYLVISSNYAHTAVSDTPSITVDNIMICTEADWKVSQKYVPYQYPAIRKNYLAWTSITTSTMIVFTGVAFTPTKTGLYRITATANYSSNKPTLLELRKSDGSSERQVVTIKSDSDSGGLTASVLVGISVGYTLKVYAQYAAESTETIGLLAEFLE